MDLTTATERAQQVRHLYHQLELSRLVMATEGRWIPEGDVTEQLEGKLASRRSVGRIEQ